MDSSCCAGAPCYRESRGDLTEGSFAVEASGLAEFFLDAKELVVFGDTIGAACGAGLDLARGGSDSQIGDESVFRFARAMRNDGGVTCFAGKLDGIDRFCNGADLVELDQNGVGDAFVNAAGTARGMGYEKVVAP